MKTNKYGKVTVVILWEMSNLHKYHLATQRLAKQSIIARHCLVQTQVYFMH